MAEKAKCKNCTTEKEIIEEMAYIIDERLIEANNVLGSMNKGKGYWLAQKLVEYYQPKIPEGSVVLQQETAKEIFAQIDKNLRECTIVNEGGYGWNYQGYEATDLRKRLTKLAKQFGVEVEE